MPAVPFCLRAVTRADRHHAFQAVQDAVRELDGWVLDCRAYAEGEVMLQLQLRAGRIGELCDALQGASLRLAAPPAALNPAIRADREVWGTLHLTFMGETPEASFPDPLPG
jgi:hypothetical protein